MDFSKAFNNVRHHLLADWEIEEQPIKLAYRKLVYLIGSNEYCNGVVCEWRREVNKGTTQGSVSGPSLFNIFLNDLRFTDLDNVSLIKFADDSSRLIVVNEQIDNF